MTNFIIPISFSNRSIFVTGRISEIKNQNQKNYGKYMIFTDSHYEPLNLQDCYTESEAKSIIQENKGIFVKDDFDTYSVEDIKEIKSSLDSSFYQNYIDRLTFED